MIRIKLIIQSLNFLMNKALSKVKIKVNSNEVTNYRFVDDDMERLEEEVGFLHYERVRKALEQVPK